MKILFWFVLIFTMQVALGQTVSVPDVNLRNKLISSYPQVMQGNELIVSQAALLTGTLDLRNAGIVNGTTIEYFTGITTLDLTGNKLTFLPDISASIGLVNIYLNFNKLTSLSSMAALTQLHDFQVMGNELTALPDLSGASGLLSLYCSDNNITQLPPLTQFPQLAYLVVGDNPIGQSIDVSPCTKLLQLHVHRCGIDTIIGLEKLTKLSMLYAWSNMIRDFSALNGITTLTKCYIYDNPVTNLPDLSNKPVLNLFDASKCLLTFEDIQPVILQGAPPTFTYAPQRNISFADATARAELPFTLSYPVSAPLSSNRYVWRKNGVIVDSSASPVYTFSSVTFADSGKYVLTVYNVSITNLILHTDTFRLSVRPCLELIIPSVNILAKDCVKGYSIDFLQNQQAGGTPPFTYELTGVYAVKSITYPTADNLEAGKYVLTVTDSKNCRASDDFILNRIDNCDPVITPNGDNIADTYYIEQTGKVTIYDPKRNVVNTLQAPVLWDGTDKNGALLDAGFYILIVEGGKPVYITIIR